MNIICTFPTFMYVYVTQLLKTCLFFWGEGVTLSFFPATLSPMLQFLTEAKISSTIFVLISHLWRKIEKQINPKLMNL